jgi:hypothetical protein
VSRFRTSEDEEALVAWLPEAIEHALEHGSWDNVDRHLDAFLSTPPPPTITPPSPILVYRDEHERGLSEA